MRSTGKDLERVLGQFLQRRNRARLYDGMLAHAPEGVDKHNYPVLSGLGRIGPSTAAQLAAEVGLDRSRVSRHADRFEDLGWIRRQPDPDDARGTLLVLTAKGKKAIAALRGGLASYLDGVIQDWPDGLADALVEGLGRLVDDSRGEARHD
ncbi:MAG: MarR DNA-binding transcription regulator [Amycolatopsis sp.]|jgi:DNA-binding MarR family transcriptional regulator|uniref:MarR family winged helix-turn-helix transcriptional regulator n=1 Tax=Amycolatopsis sp. TaxID=37632 RepID=UPI00261A4D5B|nr:MarR family transcriptional regulator [Amycolatopsis sp.]MCU1683990.1 MarR DNA-binding transcription regulator [Amycolatopsis sp.]